MLSTISKFHIGNDVYQLLEKVLETESPIEIEFKGKMFIIDLLKSSNKLSKLQPHPECLIGNPEDIVHLDWTGELHDDLS